MLPSTGLFKLINCPFYESDDCLRPFCHFRHTKKDNDTKKVTTNPTIIYNATPLGQPKIQILEPPVVYKPTPKSLLASSSSYSPPVKKPKLEYVPKSKSKCTSIATYVPSTSIKSNSDNECETPKSGWDYLSEIIDMKQTANVDATPTYVPTKIRRSTSEDGSKATEDVKLLVLNVATSTEGESIVRSTGDENVLKPTEDELKSLPDDNERKRGRSKPDRTKSRHDRHKSSSKSTSRSHSSKTKQGDSSKTTSSERSKSSKSSTSHRSTHEKSKSHSSRSDTKSSLNKSCSDSKRSSTAAKSSSRLSPKTVANNQDDQNGSKKKSSGNSSAPPASVDTFTAGSNCNVSPSSVFDTDSEEDDVMAQCRMIFEEFKEVSNNGKSDEMVNGSAKRKSIEEQMDVVAPPVDESTRKKRVAYDKAEKLRSDSKKPVVGIDHKRNAVNQIYKRYEEQKEADRKREKEKAELDAKKQLIEAAKVAALKVATATTLRLPVSISKPSYQTTTSTSTASSTSSVLTPLIPHAMRSPAFRPGQRTITPVNNFAAIQRAKEKIDQMKAAKGLTVAQSASKVTGRVAHASKAAIQNIDRPAPPVLEGSATKISYNIRIQYYNMMVKHCLTIYDNCEDAWKELRPKN